MPCTIMGTGASRSRVSPVRILQDGIQKTKGSTKDGVNIAGDSWQKVYVLVVYTSGVIGMKDNSCSGYEPGYLERLAVSHPNLCDTSCSITKEDRLKLRVTVKHSERQLTPIALPGNRDQLHVLYGILDFTPLLDSAAIRPTDWIQIAECIHDNYHNFEGFVILHGTDTMAYTSSALSFMLEGLGKAVVLTGSEYPLTMPYTDGVQNLVGSLMIAGWYGSTITEVTLFCCGKLFRGNRARKVNSSAFHSFTSPNFPPLATCAVDIKVDDHLLRCSGPLDRFTIQPTMEADVGILFLYPGITAQLIHAFLQPLKGAVIMSYGDGSGLHKEDVVAVLKEANDRGVVLLNISQCLEGHVDRSGCQLSSRQCFSAEEVLSGADMTPEASFAKLSYILGQQNLSQTQRKEALVRDLRGELTPNLDTLLKTPIT